MFYQKDGAEADAEKNEDDDETESDADGRESDWQQQATAYVDEGQQTDAAVDNVVTPQLSQHSELEGSLLSEIEYDTPGAQPSDQFDVEEALQTANDLPRQVASRSTLTSDMPLSEKGFIPDAPPDETWENEPVFKAPFFTDSVLLTSNRSSDGGVDDDENANPLGLGHAYSFVDDSKPPTRDTKPYTSYQDQFHHRNDDGASVSETYSREEIPNAPPVDMAEQPNYEEYYDHETSPPTGISEKPQAQRTRSLGQLPLRSNVQPDYDDSSFAEDDSSHEMIELSETHGSIQRSKSFFPDGTSEQTLAFTKSIRVNSHPYLGVSVAETVNSKQIYSDVYEDQYPENPNLRRNVHSSEIQETSPMHENVYPFKKHKNRRVRKTDDELEDWKINPIRNSKKSQYYDKENRQKRWIDEEIEDWQINPVQNSESSQYYDNVEERTADDDELPQQHTTLSTIFENDYSAEDIQPTYSHKNPILSHNAQRLLSGEIQEQNGYGESDQMPAVPEISESDQGVEPIQQAETPHIYDSLESALAQSSKNAIFTQSETNLRPRKSMPYSSESNRRKINQSRNSNTLEDEQLELQKDRPTTSPVHPNQLASNSAETFQSSTDVNASSENQNRSNPVGSLLKDKNVDRYIPSPPSDTVAHDEGRVELPIVARQTKKGEKEKNKRNRNKRRSNPWSMISGKPVIHDDKMGVESSKNALKRCPEQPEPRRKPTNFRCDSSLERRIVDQKTLDQKLPVTTNQSGNASSRTPSEMTITKNDTLFTYENEFESLQQRLQIGCCDRVQNEREQTQKQQLQNAAPENQQLEKVQNEHQLLDNIRKGQQLFYEAEKTKSPSEKINIEREQLEQPTLKENEQKEEHLFSRSVPLSDKTREKKKSLENERKERFRIEKAHKEHQLREKVRKDRLRFEQSQNQLLEKTSGKEQSRLKETPEGKLKLESRTKHQGYRKFESSKKECLEYRNAQREQTRLKNVKEQLRSFKNIGHEETQQRLPEKAQGEALRFEKADETPIQSYDCIEEPQRFLNPYKRDLCFEDSQATHLLLEHPRRKEVLLEKVCNEELWNKDGREEEVRFKRSTDERLMIEMLQKKLTLFNNGQKKHSQFDNFQTEDLLLKNGQRERVQLDNLPKGPPSPQSRQTEHLRFDIVQKKEPWLKYEQKEHSPFANKQNADPLPQNRQIEHLRFENVQKKFPWPQNIQKEQQLQFDNSSVKDLCLKSEQKQKQDLRVSNNLQAKFVSSQKGQNEQIRFDISQKEGTYRDHEQKEDRRPLKTLKRQEASQSTGSEKEEILENIDERNRDERQCQQKQFLWTSHSSLSIRRDVSFVSPSRRRSYSDVALALKDSLENLNNACSSIFKYESRFGNFDKDEGDISEWDTITERTVDSNLKLEELFVASSASSSGKVDLKSNACEPVGCLAEREEDKERGKRSSEPISTTRMKVWNSSKSEFLSNDLSTALMNELRDYLARYRLRVAASSDDVLNEYD